MARNSDIRATPGGVFSESTDSVTSEVIETTFVVSISYNEDTSTLTVVNNNAANQPIALDSIVDEGVRLDDAVLNGDILTLSFTGNEVANITVDLSSLSGGGDGETYTLSYVESTGVLTLVDSQGVESNVTIPPNTDTNNFVTAMSVDTDEVLTLTRSGLADLTVALPSNDVVDATLTGNFLRLTNEDNSVVEVDLSPLVVSGGNTDTFVTSAAFDESDNNLTLTLTDVNGGTSSVVVNLADLDHTVALDGVVISNPNLENSVVPGGNISITNNGSDITFTVSALAIDNTRLADDAVTAVKIANGTLTDLLFTDNTISGSRLTVNSIPDNRIMDGSITESKLNIESIPENDFVLTADDQQSGGMIWKAAQVVSDLSFTDGSSEKAGKELATTWTVSSNDEVSVVVAAPDFSSEFSGLVPPPGDDDDGNHYLASDGEWNFIGEFQDQAAGLVPPPGINNADGDHYLTGAGTWDTFELNALTDVTIFDASAGEVLAYNGTNWVDTSLSGGTGITATGTTIAIDTAVTAQLASPTFTGTVTVPATLVTDSANTAATKGYVDVETALLAPLASPTFTGTVTVPTTQDSDADTVAASKGYVDGEIPVVVTDDGEPGLVPALIDTDTPNVDRLNVLGGTGSFRPDGAGKFFARDGQDPNIYHPDAALETNRYQQVEYTASFVGVLQANDDLRIDTDDTVIANLSVANSWTLAQTFDGGADLSEEKITNVADPTNAQDAATMAYVDAGDDAYFVSNSSGTVPVAGGTDSIAIGEDASVSSGSTDAIAIGKSAAVINGIESIAVGKSARADGIGALAVGINTKAEEDNTVAIGNAAEARAIHVITIGGNGGASPQLAELHRQTESGDNDLHIATKKYVDDNSGGGSLDELTDVTITTPEDDDQLFFDTDSNEWVNVHEYQRETFTAIADFQWKTDNGDLAAQGQASTFGGNTFIFTENDSSDDPVPLRDFGGEYVQIVSGSTTVIIRKTSSLSAYAVVPKSWLFKYVVISGDFTDIVNDASVTVSGTDTSVTVVTYEALDGSHYSLEDISVTADSDGNTTFAFTGIEDDGNGPVQSVDELAELASKTYVDDQTVAEINDIGDVTITSATNNQVLTFDNDVWVNADTQSDDLKANLASPTFTGTVTIPETQDSDADAVAASKGYVDDNAGSIYVDVNSTGTAADATGTDAIAIGEGTTAVGLRAVSIGNLAEVDGQSGIAIGRGALATGSNSVAIGHDAGLDETLLAGEIRLGNYETKVTIDAVFAGQETMDNQLASVKYVDDHITRSETFINSAGYASAIAVVIDAEDDMVTLTTSTEDEFLLPEIDLNENLSFGMPAGTLSYGTDEFWQDFTVNNSDGVTTGIIGQYIGDGGADITFTEQDFTLIYQPDPDILVGTSLTFVIEAIIQNEANTNIALGATIIGSGFVDIISPPETNDTTVQVTVSPVSSNGGTAKIVKNAGVGFRVRVIGVESAPVDNMRNFALSDNLPENPDVYNIAADHVEISTELLLNTDGDIQYDPDGLGPDTNLTLLDNDTVLFRAEHIGLGNVSNEANKPDAGEHLVYQSGNAAIWLPEYYSVFNDGSLTPSADVAGGVALGSNAQATVSNSTALGSETIASGIGATAVGFDATATFVNSGAIGTALTARADNIITIGNTTQIPELGRQTASGDNDLAIATKLYVDDNSGGGSDITFNDGTNDLTTALESLTVSGSGVVITEPTDNNIALVISGGGSGEDYVSINSDGTLPNVAGAATDAIAIGESVTVGIDGVSNVAIGIGAQTDEIESVAIGASATAQFPNSGAIGANAAARAENIVTIGGTKGGTLQTVELARQTATDDNDLAISTKKYVDDNAGEEYLVVNSDGTLPVATGTDAVALGESSSATGNNSTAIGTGATAVANFSAALGNSASSTKISEIMLGADSTSTTVGAAGVADVLVRDDGFVLSNAYPNSRGSSLFNDSETEDVADWAAMNFSHFKRALPVPNGATEKGFYYYTSDQSSLGGFSLGDLASTLKYYGDNDEGWLLRTFQYNSDGDLSVSHLTWIEADATLSAIFTASDFRTLAWAADDSTNRAPVTDNDGSYTAGTWTGFDINNSNIASRTLLGTVRYFYAANGDLEYTTTLGRNAT